MGLEFGRLTLLRRCCDWLTLDLTLLSLPDGRRLRLQMSGQFARYAHQTGDRVKSYLQSCRRLVRCHCRYRWLVGRLWRLVELLWQVHRWWVSSLLHIHGRLLCHLRVELLLIHRLWLSHLRVEHLLLRRPATCR